MLAMQASWPVQQDNTDIRAVNGYSRSKGKPVNSSMTDHEELWADDGEYPRDVVIEDWGPTPGKVTLVFCTHLMAPIQKINEWRKSSAPTVATGGLRAMGSFLRDLSATGARHSLRLAAEKKG